MHQLDKWLNGIDNTKVNSEDFKNLEIKCPRRNDVPSTSAYTYTQNKKVLEPGGSIYYQALHSIKR